MSAESLPTSDPFAADIPAVICPICGETYQRQQELDSHRERHRPVVKRTPQSIRCPKGCNRWLPPKDGDTESHITLCDGGAPIPDDSEARRREWYCREHNFGTDGPKPWGLHKKEFHNGEDPVPKPVKRNVSHAVDLLKQEKMRLLKEVERVDAAIKILTPDPESQA